jgi:hypothetical protein
MAAGPLGIHVSREGFIERAIHGFSFRHPTCSALGL